MRQHPLSTWQKATALVPLALLSGAWTTSLAGFGGASAASSSSGLPDGSTVPAEAVEAPASLSAPGVIAPGVPDGTADTVAATASANGIPSAALSAYRRAAEVIDSADRSCNLSWQLVAAIGRVESDHGRYGGNTLSDAGVATPGIYGIPLDGSNGTARITDTDAGRYDNDKVLDRAVGPMQFIPSTWAMVGVDGDGDGVRNPQDIDDAALATAVYLCSGDEDLSTEAGQRAAVYRYNHSQEYVDLVLDIMRAYAGGDYTAVPNGTASAATFTPSPVASTSGPRGAKARPEGKGAGRGPGSPGGAGSSGGDDRTPPPSGGDGDSEPVTPAPGGGGGGGSTEETAKETVKKATKPAEKPTEPVVDTISAGAEAAAFCKSELGGILDSLPPTVSADTVVSKCAGKIAGMTQAEAKAAIPNTVPAVLAWLGL